uniref:Uncharacterized protein n=1 Tax=Rhizophora mucronata TaxID=61149 RepID=A0A2P2NXK9_RHIMU
MDFDQKVLSKLLK